MLPKLLVLLLLGLCQGEEDETSKGQIWAVIIAGSSGWGNYRHQSDVSHLYHMLTKKHGIPQTNVVTLMYNDIAYNRENKYPGTIINAIHGKDVYEGVMIDYMGEDVTPDTFMKVLRGQPLSIGSRKVLRSGPKDTVFVNFVDHGGPGILGFPDGELHLADLLDTLSDMNNNKMYKQMLWYVEACYSGSMFKGHLKPSMNITAHTASNSKESSYACVYDDDIDVYLGDCWSLNWMNDTEKLFPDLSQETVGQQYEKVKKMTTQSHASIYGDLTIIYNEPLSTFLGHPGSADDVTDRRDDVTDRPIVTSRVPPMAAPDILIDYLTRKSEDAETEEERREYKEQLQYHLAMKDRVIETLREIGDLVTGDVDLAARMRQDLLPIHHPLCNKQVLESFFTSCVTRPQHPYIVKHLYWLTNLCNMYSGGYIVEAVSEACKDY